MARVPVIAGNWKMYKTIGDSVDFIKKLIPLVETSQPKVYLAVPFTALKAAADAAKGSKVVIGAQNMNDATEGAFTGEIAGKMLVDAGAQFVILGHSERRQLFKETNEIINKKIKRALSVKLQPILCVGETLQERENGKMEEVLQEQLSKSLDGILSAQLTTMIIAYEPVWAIGTGKTSTPEDAQAMHHFCREFIAKTWGKETADQIIIQYGGSVKPENVKSLMEQPDIDGVLVGGASLSLESFVKIVNYSSD